MSTLTRCMAPLLLICGCTTYREASTGPHLGSQPASSDYAQASVVVLGSVTSVRGVSTSTASSRYRPVQVDVDVQRVLKGAFTVPHLSFTYYVPGKGGYDGPFHRIISKGDQGVFILLREGQALRAVNDRRAVLPVTSEPDPQATTVQEFIAGITLPTGRGCTNGAHVVASEVRSVSIPLAGSRAVWRALERQAGSADGGEAAKCACAVMASIWKVRPGCESWFEAGFVDLPGAADIAGKRSEAYEQDRVWFADDPTRWLSEVRNRWGTEGALLRLHELLRSGIVRMTPSACARLRARADVAELAHPTETERTWLNGDAQVRAAESYRRWLKEGCPITGEGLSRLAAR